MSITEWPLNPHPSPCTCAHVDTLSPPALYVPTRGTPYPLCCRVFIEQTLNTPDPPPTPSYVHETGRGGLSFTTETRHVLIPPPFPLSRPEPWDGRASATEQVSCVPDTQVVHVLFIFLQQLTRLKTTAGEKREKKQRRQLSGDACRMLLSVTSLMCAARK